MSTTSYSINTGTADTGTWNSGSNLTNQWVQVTTEGQQLTNSDDLCEDRNRDGDRCGLPGSFDDGKCHWHTDEQCFRLTNDDTPCELPGSRDDGACHHHTRGCNELNHSTVDKACYHGMKFPYRMLGLHSDTGRFGGPFSLQPKMAAEVAARVGKCYLETVGESYDRERSREYFEDSIVPKVSKDGGVLDAIKSKFNFGDDEEVELDIFKKGIEQAWKQINSKEHHANGARTAIVSAEFFLDEEVDVDV